MSSAEKYDVDCNKHKNNMQFNSEPLSFLNITKHRCLGSFLCIYCFARVILTLTLELTVLISAMVLSLDETYERGVVAEPKLKENQTIYRKKR